MATTDEKLDALKAKYVSEKITTLEFMNQYIALVNSQPKRVPTRPTKEEMRQRVIEKMEHYRGIAPRKK